MKKTIEMKTPTAVLIALALICYVAAILVAVFASKPIAAVIIGCGTLLFAAGMIIGSVKKEDNKQ